MEKIVDYKEAEWGQMSMCDAERRLLANALLDLSNERFVLLSESCIPVHNFTTVYTHLMRSKHSFLGAFDDDGPYGRGRYNENMAPEVNITQWRKGSQWFEVNRKLALAIVEDVMYYPKFQNFCKPHCYVDEHYFPTMLSIKAPQLLANRSITWVDWHRGGPHPATFGRGDISEEFLKGILDGHTCQYNHQSSSICFLFAPKEDEILEYILSQNFCELPKVAIPPEMKGKRRGQFCKFYPTVGRSTGDCISHQHLIQDYSMLDFVQILIKKAVALKIQVKELKPIKKLICKLKETPKASKLTPKGKEMERGQKSS
ncbi:hypothetical protein EJ110_NYTH48511 [Nymphaea thermarum]|nr:hypothetical protein EJ110_NYTH48511 [Nymphaea thermarum]